MEKINVTTQIQLIKTQIDYQCLVRISQQKKKIGSLVGIVIQTPALAAPKSS